MGNIFSISVSCDGIVNGCFSCVARQANIVCNLEENVTALNVAVADLTNLTSDVRRRVEIAEDQPHMKRLDQVEGWLSRADTLIHEADLLNAQNPQKIQNLCIGGYCSKSPWSNLKFRKQIAKQLRDVADHTSRGLVIERVAEEVPKPPVTEQPCEPTVGMESTFKEAWRILEKKQVGILGLYGMGGVGKTTLLNQINNEFYASPNTFQVVIWVLVSRGNYVGKVQDGIAKGLGIKDDDNWKNKTPEDKAPVIFGVLQKKKFVILLDDIWEGVDLRKVGIPRPNETNGSKLVFTTRSDEVCGHMNVDEKIYVKCLPKEKAWELFEKNVGGKTLDSNPRIRELAHELAEECGGLPLALITVARAMASKNKVDDWDYAIGVMKASSTYVLPLMDEKVYRLLKFSYDYLNEKSQTCLLYCSLFSEDYIIEKEKLIDFWIGEGILDGHSITSIVRNQGHYIIGSLIHSCLLEEIDEIKIKMHDVIRDMCLWIVKSVEKDKWRFHVGSGCNLATLEEDEDWVSINRMSFMENMIENIVETPNCPNLQTLFLNNNQLKVISNDFFRSMRGLKVLDLSANKGIVEFPAGISKLVSLQCLDLSRTSIRQLPIELKALKKLKCLNLEYVAPQITIPRKLISSFLELQALRMLGCYYSLGQEVNNDCECLVEELECLNHLNVLTLTITSAPGLDRFSSFERIRGRGCVVSLAFSFDRQ